MVHNIIPGFKDRERIEGGISKEEEFKRELVEVQRKDRKDGRE